MRCRQQPMTGFLSCVLALMPLLALRTARGDIMRMSSRQPAGHLQDR